MEKLVNDVELSSEDIVFIARNLKENTSEYLPFNHEDNSMSACGISEDDIKDINKKFTEQILESGSTRMSEIVELVETISLANPRYLRLVMIQAIKYATEKHSLQMFLNQLKKDKDNLDGV